MKCSALMRENGGAPNGVVQVSKKGFSVAVIPNFTFFQADRKQEYAFVTL